MNVEVEIKLNKFIPRHYQIDRGYDEQTEGDCKVPVCGTGRKAKVNSDCHD